MNTGHKFTETELAVIELMKHREMSSGEIEKAGIKSLQSFFLLCENNGINIYENDDDKKRSLFGVLV